MLKVLADDGYTTTTCNKDVEHHRDRARAWTTKYNVDVSKYIKDNFIRYQNDVFLWKHAYASCQLDPFPQAWTEPGKFADQSC